MQVAGLYTGAAPAEEPTGHALVRPRTPAAGIRTQWIASHTV